MANSPLPGVPQTADKANIGAVVVACTTIVLYLLGQWTGVVEVPTASLMENAVVVVVGAAISAAFTWVGVYMTRNKVKV